MSKLLRGLIAVCLLCANVRASEETLAFGRFGSVSIYRPAVQPAQVALFVSGDGGWNKGVVDMARELVAMGTLVVGVDIVRYLKALEAGGEACAYPASDFEALGQHVQRTYGFATYRPAILVGYSSGATLVYAILAQAPSGTFQGALSLGFCPDLLVTKPFCKGNGLAYKPGPKGKGVVFEPASHLESPWIALQGELDQVCDPPSTASYVSRVKGGAIVLLPKVGHGYAVPRNWLPQFKEAFRRIADASMAGLAAPRPEASLADLPLVEVPAAGPGSDILAIILSGDGGWTSLDKDVGRALAARGYPVVGLDSLQYFWKARTPDGAAKDLERILIHYLAAWKKSRAVLIGYSYGADVLPFLANRLPSKLFAKVPVTVLVGPSHSVAFEFHVAEWLGASSSKELPVLPEVRKLKGARILCLYGEGEKDSLCRELEPGLAKGIPLAGSHHFGGNYGAVADAILKELEAKAVE
jgi:type IV secretory pathway VirJ component